MQQSANWGSVETDWYTVRVSHNYPSSAVTWRAVHRERGEAHDVRKQNGRIFVADGKVGESMHVALHNVVFAASPMVADQEAPRSFLRST